MGRGACFCLPDHSQRVMTTIQHTLLYIIIFQMRNQYVISAVDFLMHFDLFFLNLETKSSGW